MSPDFQELIRSLSKNEVDCVIIGGVAMAIRGSAYATEDFDIAYSRDSENILKLVAALTPFKPRLRVQGEPNGLPFPFDTRTISNGGNFTLVTLAGNVDLLAHVDGFTNYNDLKAAASSVHAFGRKILVLSIDGLIRAKRAAGRPKDFLAIPELEVIKEAMEESPRNVE